MPITVNGDTGSLRVGDDAPNLAVGDRIQIEGEQAPRRVTYLMGNGGKRCACFKGTGLVPTGTVAWNVVETGAGSSPTETRRFATPPLTNAALSPCERCAAPSAEQRSRRVVSAGCDVAVSAADRKTGFIVLAHEPDRPLEVLEDPCNYTAPEAKKKAVEAVRRHDVQFLILDAPLLPVPTDAPPPRHCGYFRPHEKIVSQPQNKMINTADLAFVAAFANQIQAQSTWRQGGTRAPFAMEGQLLCDEVTRSTPLRYVNDFSKVPDGGIFEGFPKLFYGLAPASELAKVVPAPGARGQMDEAALRWLLDLNHPDRFWSPFGVEPPKSGADRKRLEVAFRDADQICALAMALLGLLLARGNASVLRSANRDGQFDFGHIVFPKRGRFQAWGKEWVEARLRSVVQDFPQARSWTIE